MNPSFQPLAERIRPHTLEEIAGQEHLLSKGKPLRNLIEGGVLSSFIMWGPPGTGKTTIAKMLAGRFNAEFHQINAVSSGVKDIREIIEKAKDNLTRNVKTILFIDEIHRFSKSQQDALLGAVENGTVVLIGATTENPSFEVNPALRSRTRIFKLNELSLDDVKKVILHAMANDEVLRESGVSPDKTDFEYIYTLSGGDARIALNIVESAVLISSGKSEIVIDRDVIEKVVQERAVIYDKAGEEHYNLISAMIKSIRGSDPDAAIYWLARMLTGGEDPLFIARRLIILASEDVGNASPNGLVLAEAAFSAIEKIGMPEGRIILGQVVTYLASQPKSNASYRAINTAMSEVEKMKDYGVPLHLRNAPTGYMKAIGYGTNYKYPHDYPGHFLQENYLPKELEGKQYYFPTDLGQEKALRDRLSVIWKGRKKY